MNWEAMSAIGDIVGAGAVLATLAFLAVQIRHGQRAQREANTLARSAAVDKSYDQFAGFRRLLAADPDVARIWLAGCAGETLEANDQERFYQLAIDYLMSFVMWIQRAEALDVSSMGKRATLTVVAELQRSPGLQPFWDVVGQQTSAEAQAIVSSALSVLDRR